MAFPDEDGFSANLVKVESDNANAEIAVSDVMQHGVHLADGEVVEKNSFFFKVPSFYHELGVIPRDVNRFRLTATEEEFAKNRPFGKPLIMFLNKGFFDGTTAPFDVARKMMSQDARALTTALSEKHQVPLKSYLFTLPAIQTENSPSHVMLMMVSDQGINQDILHTDIKEELAAAMPQHRGAGTSRGGDIAR